MANLPTYGRNEAAATARESQVPLADFNDGANLPASNAPGIGISTGVVNPTVDEWTTEDQHEEARVPQGTQHIGGKGIEEGNADAYYDIQAVQGADVNDTVSFIVATTEAAPGAGFGDGGAEPLNRTDETIAVGDRAWGVNTVA